MLVGACFCSSSSAFSSCFFKWHFPWQVLFSISFLTQSVLAILSWLILKETTIHILLKGCKKMRSANMNVVICFKSGAKVNIYVLISLSKCFFLSVCLLVWGRPKMAYNVLQICERFLLVQFIHLSVNPQKMARICCYKLAFCLSKL